MMDYTIKAEIFHVRTKNEKTLIKELLKEKVDEYQNQPFENYTKYKNKAFALFAEQDENSFLVLLCFKLRQDTPDVKPINSEFFHSIKDFLLSSTKDCQIEFLLDKSTQPLDDLMPKTQGLRKKTTAVFGLEKHEYKTRITRTFTGALYEFFVRVDVFQNKIEIHNESGPLVLKSILSLIEGSKRDETSINYDKPQDQEDPHPFEPEVITNILSRIEEKVDSLALQRSSARAQVPVELSVTINLESGRDAAKEGEMEERANEDSVLILFETETVVEKKASQLNEEE